MAKEQPGETLKKTRLWTSTIAAAATFVAGIAIASPAKASTDYRVEATCASGVTTFTPSTYAVTLNDTLTFENNTGVVIASSGSGVTPDGSTPIADQATQTYVITGPGELRFSSTGCGFPTFSWTIGSGGSDSSVAAASAPVEVSLSLDLAASGATCAEGSAATGVSGAWLTLPGADDCSSTTDPDAKLLGWSTSANFPVGLAQSQVDQGWGVIDDTFDGVRMIFIPAGQATFVSGPNSLHPIWAS